MKIVFFGSSHFAVASLEALIKNNYEVVCVVTQPDKQRGRHLHLSGTDVKSIAFDEKLKIFQPKDIKARESVKFLKAIGADVFVIVAYGQILSQEVLDIPKIMPVNIHASLLPRYRGAAPINWAIINGEKKSGITVIYVARLMDAGPIIMQEEVKIENEDTSITLEEKLRICGARLLIEALRCIDSRDYHLVDQKEEDVIYAPKLKKEIGLIDWGNFAVNIHNQIRGVLPWPGAFTSYGGKILKIFHSEVSAIFPNHKPLPGEVVKADKHGIVIACGRGFLKVDQLQLEGGKCMSAQNFIIGHKLAAGEVLGKK
ncbi:MAG: methionyl-tRNA formyltransferase [Candidatus Omnitrophica bacterium]|nr:methionyl-tRNA formyltransferase [Candidatus Omnitrophota bacterium]